MELKVLYWQEIGIRERFDPLYGRAIQWGVPILDGYPSQLLGSPFELVSVLANDRLDAAIIYGYADFWKLLAIATCRARGIPIIFRGTATLLEQRNLIRRLFKKVVLTGLFKLFAAFLVGGTYNMAYFRHYGVPEEKMFLVPFTVDVERFACLAEAYRRQREQIRHSLGINAPTVVTFVGTLTPNKGPHILLSAFRALARETQDACLVLVGDGVLRKDLAAWAHEWGIEDRVNFLGFINQNELPKIYAMSDFVVFPSLDDTWARAVNEAMACALPIIASRKVGAAGDIVRDGFNGFVVREGDVGELTANMRILISNPQLREMMGQASKKIITAWTYEAGIRNVLQAIEYACTGRHL